MFKIIGSEQRYNFKNEWLNATWSFSFNVRGGTGDGATIKSGDAIRVTGETVLDITAKVNSEIILIDTTLEP